MDNLKSENDVSFTLDLNGKTLYGPAKKASDGVIIKNGSGTLTICDSMGGGRVAYEEADAVNSVIYIKKGKLVVLSGTIEGTSTKSRTDSIFVAKNSSLEIHGGRINNVKNVVIGTNGGNVTITGGTVISEDAGCLIDSSYGNLTITGGTLSALKNAWAIKIYETTLTITGGTVSAENTYGIYMDNSGTYTVQISGGTVCSKDKRSHAIFICSNHGKVYLSGGTLDGGAGTAINNRVTITESLRPEGAIIKGETYSLTASPTYDNKAVMTIASKNYNGKTVTTYEPRYPGTFKYVKFVPYYFEITKQPAEYTKVTQGSISLILSVEARAPEGKNLTYQWMSNKDSKVGSNSGTKISGATKKDYEVPKTLSAGYHYYFCVIYIDGKEVGRTKAATVEIEARELNPSFTITQQPAAVTSVTEGSISATLSPKVSVTDLNRLKYQWYVSTSGPSFDNATQVKGATAKTLTITKDLKAGTYYYFCVISAEGLDSVTTEPSKVVVAPKGTKTGITISQQPVSTLTVKDGAITGSLSVSASVPGGKTLTYQWAKSLSGPNRETGEYIKGETGTTFTIPKNLKTGKYYYFCVVSADGISPVMTDITTVIVEGKPRAVLADETGGLDFNQRKAAITQYHNELKALEKAVGTNKYAVNPVTSAPYDEGALSSSYINYATKTLNFIRFLAGLPDDVSTTPELNALSQKGALLLTKEYSHYPARSSAADMSDELYEQGYKSTSSSNIAAGFSDLYRVTAFGWAADQDEKTLAESVTVVGCSTPLCSTPALGM